MGRFAKEYPRKASVYLNYRGPGARSDFKIGFVPADLQRQQVSKRDQLTYGSSRGSHNKWPKRDADVDRKTLSERNRN